MTPPRHRSGLLTAATRLSRAQDNTLSPEPTRADERGQGPGVPTPTPAPNPAAARARPEGRKLAFANFVRKGLDHARTSRAWNGSEVARRTGISRQTINRWVRGDWSTDPEPERVRAFCEGLGLDPAAAFAILEWHKPASRSTPPPPMDPDVEALLRRLTDPRISDAEKFHIRETVRYLAYRPALPTSGERAG